GFLLPKYTACVTIIQLMATNAEVTKNEGESAINLVRRFSKRVQGAGLIQRMRSRRYYSRVKSPSVRRKQALKVLRRREEVQELIKLGKMEVRTTRGPRRR
ncbi:MAG: 30S ribosomal protein S21, partial [bacterium]|nr:30S ribosomal protein S21 [bacterium]